MSTSFYIQIIGNLSLKSIIINALTFAYAAVAIQANSVLTYISMNSLVNTGNLDIISNDALPFLSLPALVSLDGQLYVTGGTVMTGMSFPMLKYITGTAGGNIYVVSNPQLVTISMPSIKSVSLSGQPNAICQNNVNIQVPTQLHSAWAAGSQCQISTSGNCPAATVCP
jgi:hypothetical protein